MTFSPGAINLASQPFRRERAQNAVYALLCLALACSLLVLVGLIFQARARASNLRREIAMERKQLTALQREQSQNSGVLARPDNADVFATSVFLNQLIARKAVSWTQVFKDLETVMPANMRLVALQLPQVAPESGSGMNHVQLDMVIGTDRPDAVIELLKRLQKSSLFGAASVVSEQPPTQNEPLYRYRITVPYGQKF